MNQFKNAIDAYNTLVAAINHALKLGGCDQVIFDALMDARIIAFNKMQELSIDRSYDDKVKCGFYLMCEKL
jgi:hypothetical protein